ncbi:DUF2232 domain-containing protein [Bacillus sp. m3-13]|uniref:DUF2232 domain-containing protein n=1 Tax=Bacillus sp. m3-13 TaxID=406124 RepID=UPI0001E899C4|nr:DUF2232 domain-containing protein [Bacillus sp. m3-13]
MKETKHITEGAALLGIYVLLLLMTLFIPFIGLITFALVVPFVVYTARNGWKSGIWLIVVAGVLSVLIGSPVALALSIPASTGGVVMGHLIQKKASRYAILGAATGVFLLNYILAYVVAIVLFNIDFIRSHARDDKGVYTGIRSNSYLARSRKCKRSGGGIRGVPRLYKLSTTYHVGINLFCTCLFLATHHLFYLLKG